MATARIEYDLELTSVRPGSDVAFTGPLQPDTLRHHAWEIGIYEWYSLGRPVNLTVTVNIP